MKRLLLVLVVLSFAAVSEARSPRYGYNNGFNRGYGYGYNQFYYNTPQPYLQSNLDLRWNGGGYRSSFGIAPVQPIIVAPPVYPAWPNPWWGW